MAVVSPAPGMGSVGFGDGLQSALFQEALLTEFKNNFAQSLTTFTGRSHVKNHRARSAQVHHVVGQNS
jgi:hypothetical protein